MRLAAPLALLPLLLLLLLLQGLSEGAAAAALSSCSVGPALPLADREAAPLAPAPLTVLLHGLPLPADGTLTEFSFAVDVRSSDTAAAESAAAPFYVQLYRACMSSVDGSPAWCLRQSIELQSSLATVGQEESASVSWAVRAGDVIGLSAASGGETPLLPLPFTQPVSAGRDTAHAIVTLFGGTRTSFDAASMGDATNAFRGADKLQGASAIFALRWKFTATSVSGQALACPSELLSEGSSCAVGSVLDEAGRTQVDATPGVSTLLLGRPFLLADQLQAVSLRLEGQQPFYLQLWRYHAPTAAVGTIGATFKDVSTTLWTLVQSRLVTPGGATSVLVVPLSWLVLPGDVLGFGSLASAGGGGVPVTFDEDEALDPSTGLGLPEQQVLQLNTSQSQQSSIGSLIDVAAGGVRLQRVYNLRLELFALCAIQGLDGGESRGIQQLLPLQPSSNPEAPVSADPVQRTTLLTGYPATDDSQLVELSFYASNTNPVLLQLYAPPDNSNIDDAEEAASNTRWVLLESVSVTPSSVGIQRVDAAWFVPRGSVLAVGSAAVSPVFFREDADPNALPLTPPPLDENGDPLPVEASLPPLDPTHEVLQFAELLPASIGQALGTTPVSLSRRIYNVRWQLRAHSWCSGFDRLSGVMEDGEVVPPGSTRIGSCASLHSLAANSSDALSVEQIATCSLQCAEGFQLTGDASLSCAVNSSGVLTGSQRCVPLPCVLPSYNHTVLGTCLSNSSLPDGSSCMLACAAGFLPNAPGLLTCTGSVLQTDFTGCTRPRDCAALTATPPTGIMRGNCSSSVPLLHGQSCLLTATAPYEVITNSLSIRCFNGQLSPLPTALKAPCAFPALTPSMLPGDCPTGGLMESGESCAVECAEGFRMFGTAAFSCTLHSLTGTLPQCRAAARCQLPGILPVGSLPGTCAPFLFLAPAQGSCKLEVAPGYALDADSSLTIRCELGELSELPTFTPLPCTLPTIPPSQHLTPGDCSDAAGGLESGAQCNVACVAGYVPETASTTMSCMKGVLSGALPQCRLPTCQLPSVLPDGLARGTCVLNSLLRNDGEVFPPSCTFAAAAGWTLSGSGEVSCVTSPDSSAEFPAAVLAPLPIAVQSMTPTTVVGVCQPGSGLFANSNWKDSSDVRVLQWSGSAQCANGFVLQSWRFGACSYNGGEGVRVEAQCVPNVLVDLSTTTKTFEHSACVIGGMAHVMMVTASATVLCPDLTSVAGLQFVACNNGAGVQMQLTCQQMVPLANQTALTGVWGQMRLRELRSCPKGRIDVSSPASRLLEGRMFERPCPYTRFNYMRGLGVSNCASSFSTESGQIGGIASCVIFDDTVPGLVAAPQRFIGADVLERGNLDGTLEPKCILFNSSVMQTVGEVASFRFFAEALGPVWLQTYARKDITSTYTVQGSFQYDVKTLGYQVVGLPLSARWRVSPDNYLGYCYGAQPVIPFSPSFSLWGHTLWFVGPAVEVGEEVGGGGDAAQPHPLQGFYSLQVGILPSNVTALGWPVVETGIADTLTDGNCILLMQPRISVVGNFTQAIFYALHNNGEVQLQTYRNVNGVLRLQGSLQTPTLKKGRQVVTLTPEQSWTVQPGDILAHCYTQSSIVFEWDNFAITNGINSLFSLQSAFYGRGENDSPSQQWSSFHGAIQTTVGEPLLGSRVKGFYGDKDQFQRKYSVQFIFTPLSACEPLPRQAQFGNGEVQCDPLYCILSCYFGYGSFNTRQTCSSSGSWGPQSKCVAVASPTISSSTQLQDQDVYSHLLSWAAPPSLPTGVVHTGWELRWHTLFPYSSDMKLEAMKGVERGGSRIFGPTTLSFKKSTDAQEQVEHVGIQYEVRMLVTGGSSLWVPLNVFAACACNMARSYEQSLQAVEWGYPLDLAVQQVMDSSNAVQFTFTPNSLCTDSYDLLVSAIDGTALNIDPVLMQAVHADTRKSCSLFSPMTKQAGRVRYPMHGRELQYCVQHRPMFLCEKCISQYNSGESGTNPQPQCVSTRHSFVVPISGSVRAAANPSSPLREGVDDVLVSAVLLDVDTMEAVQALNPQSGEWETVTAEGRTDKTGAYAFNIHSPLLAEQYYMLHVTASKVTKDEISGLSMEHELVLSGDTSTRVHEQRVAHMDYATLVDFDDRSVVPVLGRIELDSSGVWYGSTAFQGCGVPDIVVSAYSAHDTTFQTAIATSLPTGKDGQWVLTVPIFTPIVLVPAGTITQNRTFSPATRRVDVEQSLLQVEAFTDTTLASFALDIDGGLCHYHIGSVRPTAFFDTCGASAHVLLPAFAEGPGWTFTLPALVYTVKLYDSKNPFSGLASVDLDGSVLPDSYLAGDVFSFVALTVRPWTVNLTLVPPADEAMPRWSYNYVAPPEVSLDKPLCVDPKVVAANAKGYNVVAAGGYGSQKFTLTETYGYVTPTGQKRTFICQQVATGVEFLDGVSAKQAPLLADYVTKYGCTTGDHICRLPPNYDAKDFSTTVEYEFIAGEIQESNFQLTPDDLVHTQPAFSRILQWRPADSVLPWQQLYYVLAGTHVIGGSLSIVYPPHDPLYILRDPPGGASNAMLEMTSSLTSFVSLSMENRDTFGATEKLYVGGGTKLDLCATIKGGAVAPLPAPLGGGLSTQVEASPGCITLLDLKAKANLLFADKTITDNNYLRERELSVTFEESITTSNNPEFVDGDGDLFLTVSGSLTLSMSVTVSVLIEKSVLNGVTTTTCTAAKTPSTAWNEEPGNTYQWVSAYHVKNVLIHDLELSQSAMLVEAGAKTPEQLQAADPEKYDRFQRNAIALEGWQGMLDYNEELKQNAVEWPEFYASLRTPGKQEAMSSEEQLKQRDPTAIIDQNIHADSERGGRYGVKSISNRVNGMPNWFEDANGVMNEMDDRLQPAAKDGEFRAFADTIWDGHNRLPADMTDSRSDNPVGSVVFHGDPSGTDISFTLSAHSSEVSTRMVRALYAADTSTNLIIDFSAGPVIGGSKTEFAVDLLFQHGTTKTTTQERGNTLAITLGDFDQGDLFHVQILRDPVFGSPVYRTLGGRSRCPAEEGTVSREQIELLIGQSQFTHLHPSDTVATLLTIINRSPTRESFSYSLTQAMESNTAGLQLYINGQVVSSDATALTFNVEWNVNLPITLLAVRGNAAASDFYDIRLSAASSGGGQCISASTSLSVSYDEACAPVQFAGPLAVSGSFTVNSANVLASPSKTAALLISIRNPDVLQPGRSWLAQADRSYLETIDVQYRSAGESSKAILSDADWQSIKRVRDTTPSTPLLDAVRAGYAATPPSVVQDTLAMSWDMSSLADGRYQLRAVTKCKVPVGALDTSLYTHMTEVITGSMDVLQPYVLGAPLPAVGAWYPGQPISATLTKRIACDSYYGKARVQMWVNPTMVADVAAQGTPVTTRYVCSERTISIALFAPIWDNLVGRLLTVRVDRLYDTGGNEVRGGFIEWSFQVASFDAAASMSLVQGLVYNGTVADMQAAVATVKGTATATVAQVQAQLQKEVAKLTNAIVDLEVRPSPLATTSLDGLQAGGIVVTSLSTVSMRSSTFELQLHPFPQFPGDPDPRFSPAYFAHFLIRALDNGTLWQNNSATYPLLTKLRYTAGSATTSVSPVQSSANSAPLAVHSFAPAAMHVHMMRVMDAGAITTSSASVSVGLDPVDSTRCIVQVQWLASNLGATPAEVTLAGLDVSFRELPRDDMDPDLRNALQLAAYTPIDLDAWGASFIANVKSDNGGQGMFVLQILRFPTAVGGRLLDLRIDVSSGAQELYTLNQEAFLLGAPTAPILRDIQQLNAETLQVTFVASQRSGLTVETGDDGVQYVLSVRQPENATSAMIVPVGLVTFTRSTDVRGLTSVRSVIDLVQLAVNSTFVLPLNGLSSSLRVSVEAVSTSASSAQSQKVVQILSVAPSTTVSRYAQLSRTEYLLRFAPSPSDAVEHYEAVVHPGRESEAQAVPLVATPVPGSNPEMLSAVVRLPNATWILSGSLHIGVSTVTPLGHSLPVFLQALAPAYVSEPQGLQAVVKRAPTVENRTVDFELSWLAPAVVQPEGTFSPSLLRGYRVEYTFSDGAALVHAATQIASVDSSQRSVRFTLPMYVSPLLQQPTLYAFSVYAQMVSSDSTALQYRTDGTGVHTIESEAAHAIVSLQLPISNLILAPVVFDTFYSEGAGSAELLSPTSLVLGLPDSQGVVHARWPLVSNADGYRVAWFDGRSSSPVPIGMAHVTQEDEVDGVLTAAVQIVPETDAPFFIAKIAVWAHKAMPSLLPGTVQPDLESQRIVSFLSMPPLISSNTEFVPSMYDPTLRMDLPPVAMVLGSDAGFRFTVVEAEESLTLHLQFLSPRIEELRVVVRQGAPLASVLELFDTCGDSTIMRPHLVAEQMYSVSLRVDLGSTTFVALEVTPESGATRHSFVSINVQQVAAVDFRVIDAEQLGEVIPLSPPFTLGTYDYHLLLPYPTQVNCTVAVSFNPRFPLQLLDPSFLSPQLLTSNVPSTRLTLNADQKKPLQLSSVTDGLYTFHPVFRHSTIKQLRMWAAASAQQPQQELQLDYTPDTFKLAVVVPSRVSQIVLQADFHRIYQLRLSVRNGGCDTGDLLTALVPPSNLDVLPGVNRWLLCSSHGDSTVLEVVRTPLSVSRLVARVLSERGVQLLSWTSQLTGGLRTYSASVYSDAEWVSVSADFIKPRLHAFPSDDPVNADTLLLTAPKLNRTLDRASGVVSPVSQVHVALRSGESSAWFFLALGENLLSFSSGSDGNFTLRIRRLDVAFSRLHESRASNETMVALVAYDSPTSASAIGIPLELSPPFAFNETSYEVITPLMFSYAWVSITSFASTLGLVRVGEEILPTGQPSARLFVVAAGSNATTSTLTLRSEDGVEYSFHVGSRHPPDMSHFNLRVDIANSEGSFVLPDPLLQLRFDPEQREYASFISFGANRIVLDALLPANDADAYRYQYSHGSSNASIGLLPATLAEPVSFQLDGSARTHTVLVTTLHDGSYRFVFTRAEPALLQVHVDAIRSVVPLASRQLARALRLEFDAPIVSTRSRDGATVEAAPAVQHAFVPFAYGALQLTSLISGDALVRAAIADAEHGDLPLLQSSQVVTLNSSIASPQLNLSVGVNDVHVLSRDGDVHLQIVRAEPDVTVLRCTGYDAHGQLLQLPLYFSPGQADYRLSIPFVMDSVLCNALFATPQSLYVELEQAEVSGQVNASAAVTPRVITTRSYISRASVVNESAWRPAVISAQAPAPELGAALRDGVSLVSEQATVLPLAVGANQLKLSSVSDGVMSVVFERVPASSVALLRNLTVLRGNSSHDTQLPLALNRPFDSTNFSYTALLPDELAGSRITFNLTLVSPEHSYYNLSQYLSVTDLQADLSAFAHAQAVLLDEASTPAEVSAAEAVRNPLDLMGPSQLGSDGDDIQGTPFELIQIFPTFRIQVVAESGHMETYYIQFTFQNEKPLLAEAPIAAAAGVLYAATLAAFTISLLWLLFLVPLAKAERSATGVAAAMLWLALLARALLEWVLYAYPADHYLSYGTVLVVHALPALLEIVAMVAIAFLWIRRPPAKPEVPTPTQPAAPRSAPPAKSHVEHAHAAAAPKEEGSVSVRSWLLRTPLFVALFVVAMVILCLVALGTNEWPVSAGFTGVMALALFFSSGSVMPTLAVHVREVQRQDVALASDLHNFHYKPSALLRWSIGMSLAALVLGVLMAFLLLVPVAYTTAFRLHAKEYHAAYFVFDLLFLLSLLALLFLRVLHARVKPPSAPAGVPASAAPKVRWHASPQEEQGLAEEEDVHVAVEMVHMRAAPPVAQELTALSPLSAALPPLPASPELASPTGGGISPSAHFPPRANLHVHTDASRLASSSVTGSPTAEASPTEEAVPAPPSHVAAEAQRSPGPRFLIDEEEEEEEEDPQGEQPQQAKSISSPSAPADVTSSSSAPPCEEEEEKEVTARYVFRPPTPEA